LALFPRYFQAIRYWEDRDSGHWEEARKVSASSIGVATAGLAAWGDLLRERRAGVPPSAGRAEILDLVIDLVARGERALADTLPAECVQPSPQQNRRYDAALLLLLYPLDIVPGTMARQIVDDSERFLRGAIGFRRYLGDSYWAPDYDLKLSPEDRTRDFSEDMAFRDALLPSVGQEAQWCLFDSILSAHFGRRYRAEGNERDRERQTEYLNRALRQITTDGFDPPWRCPELYYLRNGVYTPNPHTPLLWAQANLLVALRSMQASATERGGGPSGGRRPMTEPNQTNGKDKSVDPGLIGNLRSELVESQKARTDLAKWKAVGIASVGAASIGLGSTASMPLLLVLLPIACLYIDLVCHHNDIRMLFIGQFLRGNVEKALSSRSSVEEYEHMCEACRSVFSLEAVALTGTTMVVAFVVGVVGWCAPMTLVEKADRGATAVGVGSEGSLSGSGSGGADVAKSPFGLDETSTRVILVDVSLIVLALSGWLWLWKKDQLGRLKQYKPGLAPLGDIGRARKAIHFGLAVTVGVMIAAWLRWRSDTPLPRLHLLWACSVGSLLFFAGGALIAFRGKAAEKLAV